MKNLLSLLIVLSVSYGIAYADGFTNESFQGTYAVRSVSGANNGGTIGPTTADGNGNFTGSAIMNVPGPSLHRRMRISTTSTGTYDINPDGTAVVTSTFTTADGLSTTIHIEGMVTQAEVVDGIKLATEFFGIAEEPATALLQGKLGLMTTFTATRLPD